MTDTPGFTDLLQKKSGRRRGKEEGDFTFPNTCPVFSPVCCNSPGKRTQAVKAQLSSPPRPHGLICQSHGARVAALLRHVHIAQEIDVLSFSPTPSPSGHTFLLPDLREPNPTGGHGDAGYVTQDSKDGPGAASPGCPAAPGTGEPGSLYASLTWSLSHPLGLEEPASP